MAKCPVFYQAATEGVPVGGIIMWSGAADAIPTGWALCNGSNGTPDLRGRFVLGAGGNYAVGAKGGEETHRLSTSEMPSHTHDINCVNQTYDAPPTAFSGSWQETKTPVIKRSGFIASSGGSTAHNNMPPYYALCYIMKL